MALDKIKSKIKNDDSSNVDKICEKVLIVEDKI